MTSCGRQHFSLEKYIQNPSKSDSTCIKDIERAKTVVENGVIIFCYPSSMGTHQLRQEKHLILLCEQFNLMFMYEPYIDMIFEGQTQGCFGAYMDKVISDKFGFGFKQHLLSQADSMMIAANDTVLYYLCDERPKRPDVGHYLESDYLTVKVSEELRKQLKADNEGKFPFMDIGFYIDKEGKTSGFFLNYFAIRDNESNQKLKDELFDFGVEQLKQIESWEPGIVNGQKVITENNVRVYF